MFILDDDKIYFKIKYPNNFDIIISAIMKDRKIYETMFSFPNRIDINYIKKMIQGIIVRDSFDYLFPNINSIKPFCYKDRLDRIEKYYYNKTDNLWFNLL